MSKQHCFFWYIISFVAGLIFAVGVIFPLLLLIHFITTDMGNKPFTPSGTPAVISYTNNHTIKFTNIIPAGTLGTHREVRLEIINGDGSREVYELTPISLRATPVTNVSTYEDWWPIFYRPEYSGVTNETLSTTGVWIETYKNVHEEKEPVYKWKTDDTNDVYRQRFLRIDHIKE